MLDRGAGDADPHLDAPVQDEIIAIATGVTLIGVGATLMRWHRRTWADQKNDATLEDNQRRFLHSRYRRRTQASGILALLGVLIPVGTFIPWKQFPGWVPIYWFPVLLLTFWVIILGFVDAWATSTHSRTALARIRQQQRALERKAAELRSRGRNGRDSGNASG